MPVIIDSHCHAWEHWPYQPQVPDPQSRGTGDQLLYEMDTNHVDKALVVAAQIEGNAENNAYVAKLCAFHANRLYHLVDLDSSWSRTYHNPGADDRLRSYHERMDIVGFTHYLAGEDDGSWLLGKHGKALFRTTAELGLMASIHCRPHQFPIISVLALQFPSVPILIHHMGHVIADNESTSNMLKQRDQLAAGPNVYLKLSGYNYATASWWNYPYPDVTPLIKQAYETFGPQRLCWGSDYPVAAKSMTYRQSMEVIRQHCPFFSERDIAWIMGDNLQQLINKD